MPLFLLQSFSFFDNRRFSISLALFPLEALRSLDCTFNACFVPAGFLSNHDYYSSSYQIEIVVTDVTSSESP